MKLTTDQIKAIMEMATSASDERANALIHANLAKERKDDPLTMNHHISEQEKAYSRYDLKLAQLRKFVEAIDLPCDEPERKSHLTKADARELKELIHEACDKRGSAGATLSTSPESKRKYHDAVVSEYIVCDRLDYLAREEA